MRLLALFDRLRDFLVSRRSRLWLAARLSAVKALVLDETSVLYDKPYIEGGVHHWKYTTKPVRIDLFYHDVPLAILVCGQHYGPYGKVCKEAGSRRFWEACLEEDMYVIDTCRRAEIPILVVGPDDPITTHSLAVGIEEALARRAS